MEEINLYAPTGSPIVGTLESIPAKCGVRLYREEDGSLSWEHYDDTTVFWDGQETETFPNGDVKWLDRDGAEWRMSELSEDAPRFVHMQNLAALDSVQDTVGGGATVWTAANLSDRRGEDICSGLNRLEYRARYSRKNPVPGSNVIPTLDGERIGEAIMLLVQRLDAEDAAGRATNNLNMLLRAKR